MKKLSFNRKMVVNATEINRISSLKGGTVYPCDTFTGCTSDNDADSCWHCSTKNCTPN